MSGSLRGPVKLSSEEEVTGCLVHCEPVKLSGEEVTGCLVHCKPVKLLSEEKVTGCLVHCEPGECNREVRLKWQWYYWSAEE